MTAVAGPSELKKGLSYEVKLSEGPTFTLCMTLPKIRALRIEQESFHEFLNRCKCMHESLTKSCDVIDCDFLYEVLFQKLYI